MSSAHEIGGKNKSVTFMILFSVYIYIYIHKQQLELAALKAGEIISKDDIYIYSALQKYWNSKDKIALLAVESQQWICDP